MSRRVAFLAFVLGFFAFACQLLAGIDRVEKEDAPLPDTYVPPDAFEAGPEPTDPCHHVLPPPPPAVDDAPGLVIGDAAGGDMGGELYFALRQVNLAPPPGTQFGYDLDESCTCVSGPGAKHDGGRSCKLANGESPCDDDGGIDNRLLTAFASFSGLVDVDKAANVNNRIDKGQQNVLLVITKYNGLANDKDIGVGIFTSEGILEDTSPDSGMAGRQPGCPGSVLTNEYWSPGWCGTDRWSVSLGTVTPVNNKFQPKVVGTGYVTNYTLVTRFTGSAVVPFIGYQLSLGSPVATGRLVPLDVQQNPVDPAKLSGPVPFWRIEGGLLAGRVPTNEILAAVGTAAQPGSDGGAGTKHVCASPLFTGLLKPAVCPAVDINLTSTLDFDPGATCDAISTAIAYRADPIVLDRIVQTPDDSNECYPTSDGKRPRGVDGVTYTCP